MDRLSSCWSAAAATARILMEPGLLDTALGALASRLLQVTVVNDDTLSEANLGHPPFYRCDLGNLKARTLIERINLAQGLDWQAVHGRAPSAVGLEGVDILSPASTPQ